MSATPSYLLRLYSGAAGLCNQLLALINGIILARRQGKTEIELSPFLTCIHSQHVTNPAKIFDLTRMSAEVGVNFVSFPVFKILYGIEGNMRDITAMALEKCKTLAGTLDIPTDDVIRAQIFGDHIPNVLKRITLIRDGSTMTFDDTKPIRMRIGDKIISQVDWSNQPFLMYWYNNFPEFDSVFSTMRFHPSFYQKVDTLLAQLDPGVKINVCHLRIEQDAIAHWSKMNKMTPEQFQHHLFELYRKYISTIPVEEYLILLTHATEHSLVEEFKSKHRVLVFKHDTPEREISAILDLLIGARCTGTFIGCHNLALKRGSTFSYFLHKMIPPELPRYFIDLDDVAFNDP